VVKPHILSELYGRAKNGKHGAGKKYRDDIDLGKIG
jgi:hypothetical protein